MVCLSVEDAGAATWGMNAPVRRARRVIRTAVAIQPDTISRKRAPERRLRPRLTALLVRTGNHRISAMACLQSKATGAATWGMNAPVAAAARIDHRISAMACLQSKA